jgi:hypothetical protein
MKKYYVESRRRGMFYIQGKRRKARWIDHILRINCLINHAIEGKIEGRMEVIGRPGRKRKQLLDDLKETTGCWKLKEEALDRTL